MIALSYIFWVVLALGMLVFVHELGHFLFARLFKMRVDAFSIGFPPNLLAKRVGETEYRIGAIPLGGYVKIAGMVDESMETAYQMRPVLDEAGRPVLGDDGEPLQEPVLNKRGKPVPSWEESEPEPDEYRAKPVWQRILVITGGVVFNLLFAWLVYSGLKMTYGEVSTAAEDVPYQILEDSFASDFGLRTGDRIVGANGEPLARVQDLDPMTLMQDELSLTVLRDGERVELRGAGPTMTDLSVATREAEEAGEEVRIDEILGYVPLSPSTLRQVSTGGAAEEAGLLAGDRVVAVGGAPVETWYDLTEAVQASGGREIAVRVARADTAAESGGLPRVAVADGEGVYEARLTPRASGDRYLVGVVGQELGAGTERITLGPLAALAAGAEETVAMTGFYFSFVGKLFTGRENFRENVGGPLIIAKQTKEAADIGPGAFWGLVAMLSIALAVFNILPIPVLDGGHLVFLLYEGITRREPSLKVRMVVQQVGMAAVLALMVFVLFNDALRWFG